MDEQKKYETIDTIERKEGITYYQCEHLDNGLMKAVSGNIWLGDTRRVILCPLCNKLEFGNQIFLAYEILGISKRKLLKRWTKYTRDVNKTIINLFRKGELS